MSKGSPQLFLAPMEGITDWVMRDTLTQIGGIDHCVTEFLRVTKNLHPKKVFLRHCPELLTGSRTRAGTPVYFQLLGGDVQPLAENAARVAELGALGIDLNFGCPAKTVNRHDGGAVLLKTPHRLFDIAKAVRANVPSSVPVSGKLRLGYEDTSLFKENLLALEEAGVQWVTVHCRTKAQGYRPPAHWQWIVTARETLRIPVIANGDITSFSSFAACQKETGAGQFMIGRASLANPFLFRKIKAQQEIFNGPEQEWCAIEKLLLPFFAASEEHVNQYFATSRTKQWLKHLALQFPAAKEIFQQTKAFMKPDDFKVALENSIVYSQKSSGARNDVLERIQS
jgi:tRNA-dihydrouridine synthase C